MKKSEYLPLCLLGLAGCTPAQQKETAKEDLPNIVFIFTDDLGYGDIGCFGASDIKTPNIDRMAQEGIQFTEFYSAASVCSPSRAGFLTGRYPRRMGIDGVFFPESFTGMPPEEITIAEMLKEKNYRTGIVGKWHLGHHFPFLPLQQGFDSYFGIPYSNDMASAVYMRGNEVEEFEVDQHYLTKRYTEEALAFIRQNREAPFFLYLAHNMPHVPIYASEDFIGSSERGLYGDVVQEIDWSVGQILKELEHQGLLENTLVIFSSDNGPWLMMEEMGGSAGFLREGKGTTFEGGFRVPAVAMWKNRIPAGVVYNELASQMDWFPTFAKITNTDLPTDRIIDGCDISPVLFQTGKREDRPYLFFWGQDLQAYRSGNWKVKEPFLSRQSTYAFRTEPAHDSLLIDLKQDPGERTNLFNDDPARARQFFEEMNRTLQEMGTLPPSLIMRQAADNSHYEYLQKKRNLQ